jgi:hypothetical protein
MQLIRFRLVHSFFVLFFIEGLDRCTNPGRQDAVIIVLATNTYESSNICGTASFHIAGTWNFEVAPQFLEIYVPLSFDFLPIPH